MWSEYGFGLRRGATAFQLAATPPPPTMDLTGRALSVIGRATGVGCTPQSLLRAPSYRSNRRAFLNWCKAAAQPDPVECPPALGIPPAPPQLPAPLPPETVPKHQPCLMPRPPPSVREDPRILVVGAGIAGLTAASRLLDAGLTNITILEGRGRPGGRIRSTVVADTVAELGADVAFPNLDSLAFRLAAADGFLEPMPQMDPARTLFVQPDGHPIDPPIVIMAYHRYRKAEEDFQRFDRSTERQLYGDFAELLGRRLRLEVQTFPAEQQHAAARIMYGLAAARRMMSPTDHRFIRKDYHERESDMAELCLGATLEFPGTPPIPLGLRGALAGLLRRIAPEIIHYNKVVTGIRWGITPTADPQVTICCEDGDVLSGQYGIITLPLGVLKEERTLFCPPLPHDKIEAIHGLEIRHVNKFFLEYDTSCWLWKDGPKVIRFAEEKSTGRQGSWVAGLSRLTEHPGSNCVLSGVVLGEHAIQMELQNDAEVIETLTRTLRRATGASCIPYPIDMVRSKWRTERFTCGAATAHEAMGPDLSTVLSEPVPGPASSVTPALLFAGEATSTKPGTLQGAAISGLREAERLLDVLGRREEESKCRIKAQCCAPS